jgi:O-antigen/teichoic acid export membrane protein
MMLRRLRGARSAEGSATRLVRGTFINAVSGGAGALVTLLLTPLLIHRLGNEAYGVWILATTVTFGLGYLSFTDLGLEQAAVRFMAQARRSGDHELFNAYLWTAFVALLVISAVVTPFVVLLAKPITGFFNIPRQLQGSAVITFEFVLAQLVFDLPGRAFSASLEAAQRYGLWQLTRIAQVR